jgi:acetyltransferase-like isoleucine patch superfamily enzyme
MQGPDPANPHPMTGFPQVCYIGNTVTAANIEIGAYTYYDDPEDAKNLQRNMLYHLPFIGDTIQSHDVWLGYEALLLPGVQIGNGGIIGTRAVVSAGLSIAWGSARH